ncbi:MAG: hypothetical protein AAF292_14360 [Pseudomonadota bacterium]
MTFKRVRLRPGSPVVNAGFAAAVIFLAACSGGEDETATSPVDNQPPQTPETSENTVVLPAVWNTEPLHAPVTDIAFAGGSAPIMLALFEDGTAQVFDLNAERLTAPAPLDVSLITSGAEQTFGEDALTVFPAIDNNGTPQIVVFNSALQAPILINSDENLDEAMGLCVSETPDDGALFSIVAVIDPTTDSADVNAYGRIVVTEDEQFDIRPAPAITVTRPYIECDYNEWHREETVFLRKGEQRSFLQFTPSGEIIAKSTLESIGKPVTIQDGITVKASKEPVTIAALTDVRFGNYPNGIIAIAGPLESGEHRITLIEPGPLFE